jgi:hypothetical protein
MATVWLCDADGEEVHPPLLAPGAGNKADPEEAKAAGMQLAQLWLNPAESAGRPRKIVTAR